VREGGGSRREEEWKRRRVAAIECWSISSLSNCHLVRRARQPWRAGIALLLHEGCGRPRIMRRGGRKARVGLIAKDEEDQVVRRPTRCFDGGALGRAQLRNNQSIDSMAKRGWKERGNHGGELQTSIRTPRFRWPR
jgi:hypothetical protein